jgi:hypothetical protein
MSYPYINFLNQLHIEKKYFDSLVLKPLEIYVNLVGQLVV